MPSSSGEKLCPICDSPLQPGSKKCGFCGTDLTIFDLEIEEPKKAPEPVSYPSKSRIDSRVDEILSKPVTREPPKPPPQPLSVQKALELPKIDYSIPEPKSVAPVAPSRTTTQVSTMEAPKPARPAELISSAIPSAPAPAVQEIAEEYFECPECGARVQASASSCPKCGVLFAEEGAEMFQCPACNTLVSVDAKSCPGCGAIFVEPEAEEVLVAPPKKDLEPPIAKVTEPLAPPKPIKELEAEGPAPPEPEEEKKGLFGRFKRKKEEEEATPKKAAAPAPTPSISTPVSKPAPAPQAIPYAVEPSVQPVEARSKGKDLKMKLAEMKPLLAIAMENEIDAGESMQLIDEAAIAGRERQVDKALDLVQKANAILLSKVDTHLTATINQLKSEMKVAQELGGDVSRCQTYIKEIERAKSSSDMEASYVYADKVRKELQPITGRYNDSKKKIASLKALISDADLFIVDTREARSQLVEATNAFDSRDFDRVDVVVRTARERLYKSIPGRMSDEMKKAKDQLLEAKMKNINISPLITILKSATTMMKNGDYAQALKEMREFREMMKKAA